MKALLPEAVHQHLKACGGFVFQTDVPLWNKDLVDFSVQTNTEVKDLKQSEEVSTIYTSCSLIKTDSGKVYVLSHGEHFYDSLSEGEKGDLSFRKRLFLKENVRRVIYFNYERDGREGALKNLPVTSTDKEINFPLKPLLLINHSFAFEKLFSMFLRNRSVNFDLATPAEGKEPAQGEKVLSEEVAQGTTFLLSSFVEKEHSDFFSSLLKATTREILSLRSPEITETVYKISSPYVGFSTELYQNLIQKATVAKCFYEKEKYLLVIDSLTLRSQEGGLVLDESGKLLGFLLPKIKVQSSSLNYLSLCVSAKEILDVVWSLSENNKPEHNFLAQQANQVSRSLNIVPSLSYRSISWASGILIDASEGLVLTAAHFFDSIGKNAWSPLDFTLRFPFAPTVTLNFQILERGKGSYDISLVKITSSRYYQEMLPNNIRLFYDPIEIPSGSEFKLSVGDGIWAIGYGFFSPKIQNMPMMSSGIISKIIQAHNIPTFVVTDCKIMEGYSGGGMFTKEGKLAGLITCNLKEKEGSKVNENLNFSIHRNIIEEIRRLYFKMKSASSSEAHSSIVSSRLYRRLWVEKDEEIEKLLSMQTRATVPIFRIKPKI